ncbi:MAG: imidazolonepropionase [Phycisphaerae bacterium]|nr:imidazolonepropionase [Phycisphaerae bacterium]
MKTLIHNIGQLVAVPPGPVRGRAMRDVPLLADAAVLIEDERIAWIGDRDAVPDRSPDLAIDARAGTVVPGLVDCHTHLVFAGSREDEFVRKIEGASYIEILEAGGGIRNSMRSLRAADEATLLAQSRPRLDRMLECGATTVEIKTGYGLSPAEELKTLRVIRQLSAESPVEIAATYLAAHTIPPEYEGRADDYIDAVTEDGLLARIGTERLASFADVFCERGAFDVEQGRRYLERCARHGLVPKVHSEQITCTGATRMAVELGAASADHLEFVDDAALAALSDSGTIPVVLPGCSFFLHSAPAPARRMIEAGLPLALATDCNPGSCMIESLPLIMSMGATMLRMTPLECLVACTANAASALRMGDRLGTMTVGYQADLLILDIPNVNQWVYRVGVNPVSRVIKRGRVILDRS